jgi:hypothetical protein
MFSEYKNSIEDNCNELLMLHTYTLLGQEYQPKVYKFY